MFWQSKLKTDLVVLNFNIHQLTCRILLKCNSDSVGLGWGLRYISQEVSDNVDASGPQTNRLAKKNVER